MDRSPIDHGSGDRRRRNHRGMTPTNDLLAADVVVTVGSRVFADELTGRGIAIEPVDWRPPRRELVEALSALWTSETSRANSAALARVQKSQPKLVDVVRAGDAVPALDEGVVLHAGPPLEGPPSGPLEGALIGALLLEGRAESEADASAMVRDGAVDTAPTHDHGAVGPMAGVIAPSMWGWVVVDEVTGVRSFSPLNEGLGQVMRFGAHGPAVLEHMRWLNGVVGPALQRAFRSTEPIDVGSIIAQALHMGDECHNRNRAASLLLFRRLASALAETATSNGELVMVLHTIGANEHLFLNVGMAAAKVALECGHRESGSSLVTVMTRNGTDFGIRLSGTGDRWFTAPAAIPNGLYFPGFSPSDANADIGDSAIVETYGLGGFAMAAAPAIVGFVGGTTARAFATTEEMREISLSESQRYVIPNLDLAGVPQGIDARLVVHSGITPRLTTGIAHREAGRGQIGAGIVDAPIECFEAAVAALAESVTKSRT
jgi:hypothetical protein